MASRSGQSVVSTAVTLSVNVEGVERASKGMQKVERAVKTNAKSMDLHTRKSRKGLQAMLESSRGAEDFSSQIGTTGLSGAFRASANNFSQMASILSPMAGVVVGLGVAFAGPLVTGLLAANKNADNFIKKLKEINRLKALKAPGKQLDKEIAGIRERQEREEAMASVANIQQARERFVKTGKSMAAEKRILSATTKAREKVLARVTGGASRDQKAIDRLLHRDSGPVSKKSIDRLAKLGTPLFGKELGLGKSKFKDLGGGARKLVAERTARAIATGEILNELPDVLKASGREDEAAELSKMNKRVTDTSNNIRKLEKDLDGFSKKLDDLQKKRKDLIEEGTREAFGMARDITAFMGGGLGNFAVTKSQTDAREVEKAAKERQRRADKIKSLEKRIKREELQERLQTAQFQLERATVGPNTAITQNQALEAALSASRDIDKATAEVEVKKIQEEIRDIARQELREMKKLVSNLKLSGGGTP